MTMVACRRSTPTRRADCWRWLVVAAATLILCSCQVNLPTGPAPELKGWNLVPTGNPVGADPDAVVRQRHASPPRAFLDGASAARSGPQPQLPPDAATSDEQPQSVTWSPDDFSLDPSAVTVRVGDDPPSRADRNAPRFAAAGQVTGTQLVASADQLPAALNTARLEHTQTRLEAGYPASVCGQAACPPGRQAELDFDGEGQFRPAGLAGPWPRDEYICDGGDDASAVEVAYDWTVRGLDPEDTVVHFDTLDGRTEVEASNRVCIYAPRFASVRQVRGLLQNEARDQLASAVREIRPQAQELRLPPDAVNQPLAAQRQVQVGVPTIFRQRQRGIGLENRQALVEFRNRFLPFEDFLIIRQGVFQADEKARLAEHVDAAISWSDHKAVQVVIERQQAVLAQGVQQPEAVYRYELPPGKPRVRIVKVASRKDALPGETVDFTIRFDNIGTETIGNVTVVDHLTPRLEYAADSAQCTLGAEFITRETSDGAQVLRWEVTDPLEPGQGGIIRFRCVVR